VSLAAIGIGALVAAAIPAGPARAAEPYDSQLAALLVPPADPAYAEITDAADPARSGPLDAARLASMGVTLTPTVASSLRGAALRGFADGGRRVVQTGYELADEASARASVGAAGGVGGDAFAVPGVPGATGRRTAAEGRAVAAVSFVVGARSFLVVVAGDDPEHGLVIEQSQRIAGEAAGSLAGAANAGPAGPAGPPASPTDATDESAGDGRGLRTMLESDDVRLALAAVAAVLCWLLVRAARRRGASAAAPRVATLQRGTAATWRHAAQAGQSSWSPAAGAPDAPLPPGTWAAATVDSLALPAAAPEPEPAPAPAAPAPAASTAAPAERESYVVPGAERWPGDAAGDAS
jgi:hypothetical protein